MKRKVLLFLGLVAVLIALLPTYNLCMRTHLRFPELKPWAREVLFNFDDVSAWVSRRVYGYGISIAPKQAVLGQDGWMYLGDQYAETLSVTRRGGAGADKAVIEKTRAGMQGWKEWFEGQGIPIFRVLIGPNTASIYPEHLPQWAQPPAGPDATDLLVQNSADTGYVDPRPALRKIKAQGGERLYYKTDTHWNALGAWVAYRALAENIQRTSSEPIRWLTEKDIEIRNNQHSDLGGLAKFLRIGENLENGTPTIKIIEPKELQVTQINYSNGKIEKSGPNIQTGTPVKHPILLQSNFALNHKKVLWLRDSFGKALSPFITATFEQNLQYFWSKGLSNPDELKALIRSFQPDFVLITVVERDDFSPIFSKNNSVCCKKNQIKLTFGDFFQTNKSEIVDAKDVRPNFEGYQVIGTDPYWVYRFPAPIQTQHEQFILIDATCENYTEKINGQLFWLADGDASYSAEHNLAFEFKPGPNVLDLSRVPGWGNIKQVHRLRFDLETPSCKQVQVAPIQIGTSKEQARRLNLKAYSPPNSAPAAKATATLAPPPPVAPKQYRPQTEMQLVRTNDAKPDQPSGWFVSTGVDPYWVFQLATPIDSKKIQAIKVNWTCPGINTPMPGQLFWIPENGHVFTGEYRMAFSANAGGDWVEMTQAPGWAQAGKIRYLRLDLESPHCKHLQLEPLILGD